MSKVLEQNGIENTSLDAARFNRFCTGYKDGIIKGSFSECDMTLLASNVLQVEKGELIISGFRVILSPTTFTFKAFPITPTRYQIIAQIQLNNNSQPVFTVFVQNITELKKEDLFDEKLDGAIYQVEIGRYSLENESVIDIVKTLDVLSKVDNSNGGFAIGSVSTEKISPDMEAEVDVDETVDDEGRKVLNFKFHLPIDIADKVNEIANDVLQQVATRSGTTVKVNGEDVFEFDADEFSDDIINKSKLYHHHINISKSESYTNSAGQNLRTNRLNCSCNLYTRTEEPFTLKSLAKYLYKLGVGQWNYMDCSGLYIYDLQNSNNSHCNLVGLGGYGYADYYLYFYYNRIFMHETSGLLSQASAYMLNTNTANSEDWTITDTVTEI